MEPARPRGPGRQRACSTEHPGSLKPSARPIAGAWGPRPRGMLHPRVAALLALLLLLLAQRGQAQHDLSLWGADGLSQFARLLRQEGGEVAQSSQRPYTPEECMLDNLADVINGCDPGNNTRGGGGIRDATIKLLRRGGWAGRAPAMYRAPTQASRTFAGAGSVMREGLRDACRYCVLGNATTTATGNTTSEVRRSTVHSIVDPSRLVVEPASLSSQPVLLPLLLCLGGVVLAGHEVLAARRHLRHHQQPDVAVRPDDRRADHHRSSAGAGSLRPGERCSSVS